MSHINIPVNIYDTTMFNNLKHTTYLYIYIIWPNKSEHIDRETITGDIGVGAHSYVKMLTPNDQTDLKKLRREGGGVQLPTGV